MIIRYLLCIVCVCSAAAAQSFRASPDAFYIGTGEDASLEVARSRAYASMVEQIQVLVSSSLRTSTTEHGAALQNTAERSTLSMSSIVLSDVGEHIDETQGVYRVTKYVPKAVVRSVFAKRRGQIVEYLAAAEAEGRGTGTVDVQRMLFTYYKAWLLAGLYPDTLSYPFEYGGFAGVSTGIPQAMQRVCDKIAFLPAKRIDDEYTTWKYTVEWAGRPVSRLRFTFHDGLGESEEDVANGIARATFLFTDKRERMIPASVEYHEQVMQDPLLAAADSTRSPYAPSLSIHFMLPGGADPVEDKAGSQAQPNRDSPKPALPVLPRVLAQFAGKHADPAFFKSEISRLSKRGEIIAGKKTDFESPEGLYVLVVNSDGVQAILVYRNGAYINTQTGETITLPAYAGKRILWVRVQ